jgi:hypothetical protein
MKTSELTGAALDWAVAKAEGLLEPKEFFGKMVAPVVLDMEYWSDGEPMVRLNPCPDVYYRAEYDPSTDWKHGGPIIEEEGIFVRPKTTGGWRCWIYDGKGEGIKFDQHGATPLVAAMRCYVASKLGDEINIPKELL